MRKVTQQIKAAWEAGKSRTVGNTHTDGKSVWLHGNEIIRRNEDGSVECSNAGWPTMTTHERLNGILGGGFYRKNWATHYGSYSYQKGGETEFSDATWYDMDVLRKAIA